MKRPSSEGSISRIRSPRGVERTDREKGPECRVKSMALADDFMSLVVWFRRSMRSVTDGIAGVVIKVKLNLVQHV